MTTIRRINVSQINGNGADDTSNDEIRPQYETAFYLDSNSKLTLMMFDGTRTHRKSKVLSPGILYGSNADSGDNNGYDTIKLIPDATLKANGSDQYLIVDPAGPNHIHIRAGGPQDDSGTQLYIGGENSYFRVNDGVNPNLYIAANSSVWTFDGNGDITIPSSGADTYTIGESEPGLVFTSTQGFGFVANVNGSSQYLTFGTNSLLNSTSNIQLRSAGIKADQTATVAGTIINVPLNAAGDTVDYTGGASFIEVPTNADTSQVQPGWIITFNGGARRTVSTVAVGGGYTSIYYSEASPGGTLYPLTIESADYVAPNDGNVYITPNINSSSSPTWTFANSGLTTIPGSLLSSTGSVSFIANSSGDGNGYSTIEITPDITLNTDQYLVIDPTAGPGGGHIHIRAGGTQDASTTELYLGGENSYFKVGAGSNPAVYARANGAEWIFGIDGNLTLPSGGSIIMDSSSSCTIDGVTSIIFADNTTMTTAAVGSSYGDSNVATLLGSFGSNSISTTGNVTAANFTGNISITGNVTGTSANVELVAGSYTSTFDNTGNVSLPGNLSVTGNISANVSGFAIGYRDVPQVSFTGDATLAAADAGKHFYSTLSTANTLTIANNAVVSWPVGTAITIVNRGTGNITVAQGTGVSLYLAGNSTAASRTVTTYGMATLLNVAANVWMINGTGVS